MWPKVFAQLVELLPHISRLVPMADKFFTSRTASEKANEAAMRALAEDVRGDLSQVTSANAGLYRQLQDHSAQIAELAVTTRHVRAAVDSTADHIAHVHARLDLLDVWIKVAVALLVLLLCGTVALFLHLR